MNKLHEIDTVAYPALPGAGQAGESAPPNPILLAHSLFRGRYWLVVPLAIAAAIPAAWFGYHAMPPKYESTGIIRVRSTLPKLVYEVEENQALPGSFVATQAEMVKLPRVMERAVQSPRLRQAGWPPPPEGMAKLRGSIKVSVSRHTELINVSVEDTDPGRAYVAVQAVMSAVEELFISEAKQVLAARQRELDTVLNTLRSQRRGVQAELDAARGTYYVEEIQPLLVLMRTERFNLEQALHQKLQQVEILKRESPQVAKGADGEPAAEPITPEQLAAFDPRLEALLNDRSRLEAEIRVRSKEYGPRHPWMMEQHDRLALIQEAIDHRFGLIQNSTGDDGLGQSIAARRIANLEELIRMDQERIKQIEGEIRVINDTKQRVEARQRDLADIDTQINTVQDRLRKLMTEHQGREDELSRITIESWGDRPLGPSKDRRLPLAAASAGAAGGAVVGLFGLFGLLRREYRYVDDVGALDAPFLGTIPALSTKDREADEMAALCVHHVRNLLQMQTAAEDRSGATVYAVTSPTAGDGKTSLTVALGMSFAAAGYETIVVDADLVGEGLTSQVQMTGRPGFKDVIQTGRVNGELISAGVPKLRVLPAGAASLRPEELAQRDVDAVVAQLRRSAEIVIIDTGPMPGCLEADLVATSSDAVILTVSRGSRAPMVRAAIRRLRTLNASCAGIVFNRASRIDCQRSGSISSQSLRSARALTVADQPDGQRHAMARALLRDQAEEGAD